MNGDFTQGKVGTRILNQAVPLLIAQVVQLLYNIVDRIYIGHMADIGDIALTGIGLTFPLVTLVGAFTNMCGVGGSSLFAIKRGAKADDEAEVILSNTFTMLLGFSVILLAVCYIFRRPILFLFGASEDSFFYANEYLKIYLIGTPFTMIATGMNGFINAQGFPRIGMLTVSIGAILNLGLDPLFMFTFGLGVKGAAIATVISQAASAAWVLIFFLGKKPEITISIKCMKLKWKEVWRIICLGFPSFIAQGTNSAVQAVNNATLGKFGGDLFIGIMTVTNSVRDVLHLPISGLSSGSQPVLGYNYGAKEYERVKKGIRFIALWGTVFLAVCWLAAVLFPRFFMGLFTTNEAMIETGTSYLKLYFFGFFFMAFQFTGQSTFVALGKAKRAITFSLFRKVVIVIPLAIILPRMGLGVKGVFLAEPISNFVGGMVCVLTMYFTLYRKLGREEEGKDPKKLEDRSAN